MAEALPVAANVNYSLQPVVQFTGENWSIFNAAFSNYARQQGFYGVLGEEGAREPEEHPERWRQKMAQDTTALCSGWMRDKVLFVFRYTSGENAHSLWRKLSMFYGNITDVRQLQLRDRAERYRQENQPLMDWLGGLNSRVADLEASGHNCDDTYRKQLVRHNCNDRFRPIIQQLLLASPRST